MSRTAAILLTGLVSCSHAAAQDKVEYDDVRPQIWIDYNPSFQFGEGWHLYGDVGARTELSERGWWRLVVRPSVRYDLNDRIWFGGGVGSFYSFNDAAISSDRWEVRPWQGAFATWPSWVVDFHHFVRVEERFDFDTKTWETAASLRLRYQMSASYQWDSFISRGQYWAASAMFELFGTIVGQQGQSREQVRTALGIERSFARSFRMQFEAVWQRRGLLFIAGESVSDIFLRVRVFQSWL